MPIKILPDDVLAFQTKLATYYHSHGRHSLPWRLPDQMNRYDPYAILVSELMLQQTQVQRVIPKYLSFLSRFPTIASLAAAPLGEVLANWQGLGYNRRAKYLLQSAAALKDRPFPKTNRDLCSLPGVGKNTAGAIQAYAFNIPSLFIETNVRSVLLEEFFQGLQNVPDAELLDVLATVLDKAEPRIFYWALMDYGSYLKSTRPNPSIRSASYHKQTSFQGSKRQLRGRLIRALAERPHTEADLQINLQDERIPQVLQDLKQEGLIRKRGGLWSL